MQNRLYVDEGGIVSEICRDTGRKKMIRFPVCLSVTCKEELNEVCRDFVLMTKQKQLFVKTRSPLPKGANVVLHFFVPPASKVFAPFRGRVVQTYQGQRSGEQGMQIELGRSSVEPLHLLQGYFDEKMPLVDLII